MSTIMLTLLIIGALIFLLLVFVIIRYNRFIYLKMFAQEAFSGIDVQLKRRHDLVHSLVSIVKGASFHEKDIIENLVNMRAISLQAKTVDEKVKAENGITHALRTIFAFSESYPQLRANENFLELQKEISTIEHELQLSRRYYNGAARNYNISITTFPSHLIAPIFHFSSLPYFEVFEESND